MHGIICVYKPCGISSNFVLNCLKKSLNIKKLGHLGTLDPLACGVLPVMVNKGTKLFDFYLSKNKTYRAIFTFGKQTNTLDSEGEIVETSKHIPSETEINKVLPNFLGNISQIPPEFSAKNVNGKRAYELARKGLDVILAPKNVTVNSFKLIKQINETSFLFEICCSSGTYIRSLARDLGKMLNSCAFMSALIRTKSGKFDILNSTCFKNLTKENVSDKIISLETLLSCQEKIVLNSNLFQKISNGVKVQFVHEDAKNLVVYCQNKLIGIGEICANMLSIKTNLQV